MKFKLTHNNLNVLDLERSLKFYEKALDLKEVRRKTDPKGNYILVWIQNDQASHQIELTWLKERTEPYNLGDNEVHIGFQTDDYEAAYEKHKTMGCVCFENPDMGIYFIEDPDGYWLEVVPVR